MDSDLRKSIALLAIKPRFADAIMGGSKRVEFRKTLFSQPPRIVVLYASAPVKQVVAYFTVAYIKQLTPLGLWRQFREHGGIEYHEFASYYGTAARGVAIGVGDVSLLGTPVELSDLHPTLTVPQSFRYLDQHTFAKLL